MSLKQTSKIKHIGLVRLSAIGDVVLCLPLVRTVQACLPHVRITWIIDKVAYQLLKGLTGVDFVVIDKPNGLRDYWALKKRFSAYSFDVLFAMQASFRANLLYPLIQAKRKIGFDKKRARDLHHLFVNETVTAGLDHLLDGFLRFAEKLGVRDRVIQWNLPLEKKDVEVARSLLPEGPVIAINPQASKDERNWYVERYVELIKVIEKRFQARVVLTGGLNDVVITQQISQASNAINLAGKTTLKQMACVLAEARVLIAPDTGPAHIATAVGTPVIGLYAVAPSKLSGPYLSKELVIDKFDEAVRKILKRDPNQVPWGTRVHDQRAMALITVRDVVEKLDAVFRVLAPA